jgi:hypothetical protein
MDSMELGDQDHSCFLCVSGMFGASATIQDLSPKITNDHWGVRPHKVPMNPYESTSWLTFPYISPRLVSSSAASQRWYCQKMDGYRCLKIDPSIGGPIGTLAFSAAIWLLRMERFFPLCGRVDPQPKDHFSIEVSHGVWLHHRGSLWLSQWIQRW